MECPSAAQWMGTLRLGSGWSTSRRDPFGTQAMHHQDTTTDGIGKPTIFVASLEIAFSWCLRVFVVIIIVEVVLPKTPCVRIYEQTNGRNENWNCKELLVGIVLTLVFAPRRVFTMDLKSVFRL